MSAIHRSDVWWAGGGPTLTLDADFGQAKNRGDRVYCKLCTPPERRQGQPMTLAAAIRHESSTKHLEKVQEQGRSTNTCSQTVPAPDSTMPSYINAWDWSSTSLRVDDFIQFWQEGVTAALCGEVGETMESFIDRYNKKYHDWVAEEWKRDNAWEVPMDAAAWEGPQDDPAAWGGPIGPGVGENEWDGVPGQWFTGGSFLPNEAGVWEVGHQTSVQFTGTLPVQPVGGLMPSMAEVWGLPEEDPYDAWGVSPDEVNLWAAGNAPVGVDLPARQESASKSRARRAKNGGQRKGGQATKGVQGKKTSRGGLKEGGNVNSTSRPRWKQQAKIQ